MWFLKSVKLETITNRQRLVIGLCPILLIIFLYFFRLGANGFYNGDEERFALADQEMLRAGNWFTPTIRGNPLVTKPILLYLLILFPSYLAGRVSEFTVKLPSAVAGLAVLGITFSFGKELWGRRAGWLAALVLATSYGYFWQARVAQADMVLTFFITLAIFCFYLGFRSGSAKKRRYYLLSYASMALATLTKGPVGMLLPLAIIFIFLALTKNLSKLREMALPRGVFLYLLIILPWFLLLSIDSNLGIVMIKRVFFQENLIRYQTLSKNVRPFYYYIFTLMGGLSLWCWMLPGAISSIFTERTPEQREKYLFLIIWLVFTLVFFSLAPFKRDHYLSPLYPAAALLIGQAWNSVFLGDPSPLVTSALGWGVKISFFLLLLGAPVYAGYIAYQFPERLNPYFISYLIFLIITAYAAYLLFHSKKPLWSFACIFLQSYLFLFLLSAQAIPYPGKGRYESFKGVAQRIMDIMQPGEEVIAYKFWKAGVDYYLDRHISRVNDPVYLVRQFQRKERIYCLLEAKSQNEIRPFIGANHWIIGERRYGHHKLVVISNKARPALAP